MPYGYREGEGGFSLVEILVTMAIITLLATLAIPFYSNWQDSARLKNISWDLLSTIRSARQLAITENLQHRIELEIGNRRYRLSRGNSSTGSTVWTVVRPHRSIESNLNWATYTADLSTCNVSTDKNIIFSPNGTASSSSSAQAEGICLKDAVTGSELQIISIAKVTGKVTLINP